MQDGDAVVLIKRLNVKCAESDLNSGTKVKKIRLVEGDHDIDFNFAEFEAMKSKSEFVKKV